MNVKSQQTATLFWESGKLAYAVGFKLKDCPLSLRSDAAKWWKAGWAAACDDAIRKNERSVLRAKTEHGEAATVGAEGTGAEK